MRWFQALMPREEQFVGLFSRHADTLIKGAGELRSLLEGGPAIGDHSAAIMRYEEDADQIARETLLMVRRTFITPFDRSDIKELTASLDDAIDQMQKTAKAITMFEVTTFEPQMREMADLIVKAANLTVEAMPLMIDLRKNATRLNSITEAITKVEEEADHVCDIGIKALFLASRDAKDPMAFIIGNEIYDHLEKVVDRFEDVANHVSGVVIENL